MAKRIPRPCGERPLGAAPRVVAGGLAGAFAPAAGRRRAHIEPAAGLADAVHVGIDPAGRCVIDAGHGVAVEHGVEAGICPGQGLAHVARAQTALAGGGAPFGHLLVEAGLGAAKARLTALEPADCT